MNCKKSKQVNCRKFIINFVFADDMIEHASLHDLDLNGAMDQ